MVNISREGDFKKLFELVLEIKNELNSIKNRLDYYESYILHKKREYNKNRYFFLINDLLIKKKKITPNDLIAEIGITRPTASNLLVSFSKEYKDKAILIEENKKAKYVLYDLNYYKQQREEIKERVYNLFNNLIKHTEEISINDLINKGLKEVEAKEVLNKIKNNNKNIVTEYKNNIIYLVNIDIKKQKDKERFIKMLKEVRGI